MKFSQEALRLFAFESRRVRLTIVLAEGDAPQSVVGALVGVLADGGVVVRLNKIGDIDVARACLHDLELLIEEEPTPPPTV